MPPLEKLLSEESPEFATAQNKGTEGEESDWIEFADITCKSGKFLVIDPAFAPNAGDGVVVECPRGAYQLDAKVIRYGRDLRVSRLRALKVGTKPDSRNEPEQIGEAWADVAAIGVCDAEEFAKAFLDDEDEAEELIEEYLDEGKAAGSIILEGHEDTPLRYVSSGFGDGTFPVYALTSDGKRVGFEVEFIEKAAAYPFGESATDEPEQEKKENPVLQAMFSALKGYKRTGDKAADKEQVRALMDKAAAPFQEDLRSGAEDIHQRVIKRRKSAPPMEMKLTRCSEPQLSERGPYCANFRSLDSRLSGTSTPASALITPPWPSCLEPESMRTSATPARKHCFCWRATGRTKPLSPRKTT